VDTGECLGQFNLDNPSTSFVHRYTYWLWALYSLHRPKGIFSTLIYPKLLSSNGRLSGVYLPFFMRL
jgi:hypothetical protein